MTAARQALTVDWSALPRIYFVRHGQTDWNAESRLQGQSDIDLNATGRAQAQGNGRRLRELLDNPQDWRFVASPMSRARETMELARVELGLPRDGYETDARLKEINFGDWQGFTIAEMEQRQPGFAEMRQRDKWNVVPPGADAESYRDLANRVTPWLTSVREQTVCVSHGGVMRAFVWLVLGADDNAASQMEMPQDRVLRLENGVFTWL